jgi:hypothetical protein
VGQGRRRHMVLRVAATQLGRLIEALDCARVKDNAKPPRFQVSVATRQAPVASGSLL